MSSWIPGKSLEKRLRKRLKDGVGWDFEELLLLVAEYDAEKESFFENLAASEPNNPLHRIEWPSKHFRGTAEIEELIQFLIELATKPQRYKLALGDVLATAILRTNALRGMNHPPIARLMDELFTALEAKHGDILAKLVFDTCRKELSR